MWVVFEYCRFTGRRNSTGYGFGNLEDAVNFVMLAYTPLDWAVLDITIQEI